MRVFFGMKSATNWRKMNHKKLKTNGEESMDNNIFEVCRDEYVGFLGQIKQERLRREYEGCDEESKYTIKTYSKTSNELLCEKFVQDEQVKYYVYNMPPEEDRQAPPTIRKVILENQEEVQAFIKAFNEWQAGDKNNGRDISECSRRV